MSFKNWILYMFWLKLFVLWLELAEVQVTGHTANQVKGPRTQGSNQQSSSLYKWQISTGNRNRFSSKNHNKSNKKCTMLQVVKATKEILFVLIIWNFFSYRPKEWMPESPSGLLMSYIAPADQVKSTTKQKLLPPAIMSVPSAAYYLLWWNCTTMHVMLSVLRLE